jgi:glycosyltransferase involved in cell wall biosynthesis
MKTQNSPKISALLITYNEILHIDEVLKNLSFADEIIVVDSFSTDGTVEAVKAFPQVQLFQNPFVDFTSQRTFALTKASYDWILFIDADERLPDATIAEIKAEIQKPDAHDAYLMRRKIYFKGRRLRFGGRMTDKIHRLFRKEKAHYIPGRLVHEKLRVNGTTGLLKNALIHYPYQSFAHYEAKRIHYAKLKARELKAKGKKPNAVWYFLKAVYKFVRHYFLKFGIFDGLSGLVLAYLTAKYVYMRYVYFKQLN